MKPPKFHIEKRGTKRHPIYCVRYHVNGKRYREHPGARTLSEYEAFVQQLARKFLLGKWMPPTAGPRDGLTFAGWAPEAIRKRAALGVKTAATDEDAIVRIHLIPEFGDELLEDLTTLQRVVAGFDRIRANVRAGSTVRNIHVVFAAVMRLAAKAGKIDHPPPLLTVKDGELPPVVSVRPEGWRADAKFTREEIAALVSCEEIELQYRVMYVVWFLTGGRFAEVVPVKWRHWNRDRPLLGSLTLGAVKTRRHQGKLYRVVPVHPTLAAWLLWWHREGFELVHMRAPQPDDLMFPTLATPRVLATRIAKLSKRLGRELGAQMGAQVAYNELFSKWQRRHLPAAGLRHRRLHDSRGTFISIIRSAGAQGDVVRSITHRAVTDKVLDEGYTVWEWEVVCKAISAVDWRLPGPPSSKSVVVQMRRRTRDE